MIEDFFKDNKCSKCGECCGPYLPLTNEDVKRIIKYVKDNNFIAKEPLREEDKMCPFLDKTKENKCKIYNIRPEICRIYTCRHARNQQLEMAKNNFQPKPELINLEERTFYLKRPIPMDMWNLLK